MKDNPLIYWCQSSSSLVDAYKALIEVTREDADPASSTGSKAAKERQLAEDYLDEVPNSARTIRIRKRIIDGSRRCLEKQYVSRNNALK